MFQSTDFVFDGKRGSNYGIFMVYVGDSGLVEQSFGIKRKSVTERVKNRHKVYSYGFETEVLEMNLKFTKETPWTNNDRVEFKRWFIQNGYRVFKADDFDIEFDLACVGEPIFYLAADGKGYFDIHMESNVPFGYSPTSVEEHDLSANTASGTILTWYNKSNIPDFYYYKPEVEVTLTGTATTFSFINNSDGGRKFEYTNLTALETIYTDNAAERIFSVLSETRLNNLTGKSFFRLIYGANSVKIFGTCIIRLRYRYPMMV